MENEKRNYIIKFLGPVDGEKLFQNRICFIDGVNKWDAENKFMRLNPNVLVLQVEEDV